MSNIETEVAAIRKCLAAGPISINTPKQACKLWTGQKLEKRADKDDSDDCGEAGSSDPRCRDAD
jgi:hypothetical protein